MSKARYKVQMHIWYCLLIRKCVFYLLGVCRLIRYILEYCTGREFEYFHKQQPTRALAIGIYLCPLSAVLLLILKAIFWCNLVKIIAPMEGWGHLGHSTSQLDQSPPTGSSHWKIKELQKLGQLVQRRLSYLQNPKNCTAAKKVLCRITKNGFGSNLHHLTFCLIVAYATERTLILKSKGWKYARDGWETMFLPLSSNCISTVNHKVTETTDLRNIAHIKEIEIPQMQLLSYLPAYLPLAIPADLADKLIRVHRDPSLWWIGQFVTYLSRPNEETRYYLKQSQERLAFRLPIVGIHVRRTDKIGDTQHKGLDEYMEHVHKWFNQHEKNVSQWRYVYLATDNPDVLKEARHKYPNYKFINDEKASITAKSARFTETSLHGIVLDVHMLSMCDFVVCTMTSNICRLVFELRQARDGEASERLISLDIDYFLNKYPNKRYMQKVKENGGSRVNMTGVSLVHDRRHKPFKPYFTADNKRERVAMPVYSEVN